MRSKTGRRLIVEQLGERLLLKPLNTQKNTGWRGGHSTKGEQAFISEGGSWDGTTATWKNRTNRWEVSGGQAKQWCPVVIGGDIQGKTPPIKMKQLTTKGGGGGPVRSETNGSLEGVT